MKKIFILTLVFSLMFVAQTAFASWWNPFTWKVFNKTKEQPYVQNLTDLSSQEKQVGGTFYTKNTARVRKCPSISCDIIGTYSINTEFTLQYKTVADLPEWVEISWIENDGHGYLNKISLSNIKTNVVVKDAIPPQSDALLCNGTYWSQCLSGKEFYCPNKGEAMCISSWSELESNGFYEANQKGWISLIVTNDLGEKRYYRKENDIWIRKNSEAEAVTQIVNYKQKCMDEALASYTQYLKETNENQNNYSGLSVENQIRLNNMRTENLSDYLYAYRIACGDVTTEEQMVNELKKINNTLKQMNY